MNVLLIGGTGLVGSHLLSKLVDCRHNVLALTRQSNKIDKINRLGAKGIVGDIRRPVEWDHSVKDIDVIILLTMPSITPGKRINKKRKAELTAETNDFFSNSMELAMKFEVPIILPGGTSYKTTGDEVADETWPIHRAGLTEIGKDTDDMVLNAIQHKKPQVIQLLYGKIYGNGGLFRFQYEMMAKNRAKIIGSGENFIPNIHADDAAMAIMKTIETMPVGERIIIADDTPVTQRDFLLKMADLMGKKTPGKVPGFVIRLVLGKDFYEVVNTNCKVSNLKAKKLLGWKPQYPSYQDGLYPTIKEMEHSKPLFE